MACFLQVTGMDAVTVVGLWSGRVTWHSTQFLLKHRRCVTCKLLESLKLALELSV